MSPRYNRHWEEERQTHFGSPYAPGTRYWLEEDVRYSIPAEIRGGRPHGTPYAPGPQYEPYELEREEHYGIWRYGSPYAPGPAYEVGAMDRAYQRSEDRFGSPYAPGPGYPQGPYTGIGPRNYQRSDQRIFEDVCDRLMQHDGIDAGQMDVKVENGLVNLSGNVDSLWTKRAAEDTAYSVAGVVDVQNELQLSWSGRHRTNYYSLRTGREDFKIGMSVVGRDGRLIGTIKEVRSYDFLVQRESETDLYVPFGATLAADGGVILDIPAQAVDQQGWPEA